MAFSIHQMDELEYSEGEFESALDEYIATLLEQFQAAPEGKALHEAESPPGWWSSQLISLGYTHLGATLPKMSLEEVDEIVTELFPRKVSLSDPETAGEVIPELKAFWHFLKREYQLESADTVVAFLREIEPAFEVIMNNPENFGIAKSFYTAGVNAGFDMNTPEGINAFQSAYNASLAQGHAGAPEFLGAEGFPGWIPDRSPMSPSSHDKAKKKRLRQQAKKSRRKNRKR